MKASYLVIALLATVDVAVGSGMTITVNGEDATPRENPAPVKKQGGGGLLLGPSKVPPKMLVTKRSLSVVRNSNTAVAKLKGRCSQITKNLQIIKGSTNFGAVEADYNRFLAELDQLKTSPAYVTQTGDVYSYTAACEANATECDAKLSTIETGINRLLRTASGN